MAHYDLLTGLANRALFLERTEEAGGRLRQHGEVFSVLLLGLDHFKGINDTLGTLLATPCWWRWPSGLQPRCAKAIP